ncbi:MAG TPA: hypothetical protein VGR35_08105 [Tepidisphaeraceae bacterium]|nr:hypothetical protein [Tepidisphaeraceae bacterium]
MKVGTCEMCDGSKVDVVLPGDDEPGAVLIILTLGTDDMAAVSMPAAQAEELARGILRRVSFIAR